MSRHWWRSQRCSVALPQSGVPSFIVGPTCVFGLPLTHATDRTIITNVPTVDLSPEPLAVTILRLNPHLYTPHQAHPTPAEAAAHIREVDQMLDLLTGLLHLDATKRLTASAALSHPFLDADEEPDDYLDPTEGKCGHLHEWTAEGQRECKPKELLLTLKTARALARW